METILKNNILKLRPATLGDKIKIYFWLAHSNLTSEMLGPPNFPDIPVPTWEEFNEDYLDYYFNGSKPMQGRCFIIIYGEEEIGQINYNHIDSSTKSTEMDIWLADLKYTGKGLGTEAIKLLCQYLNTQFRCKSIYIAPSRRNVKAIKAYEKAGFVETKILPNNFIPDYQDTVVLLKTLPDN